MWQMVTVPAKGGVRMAARRFVGTCPVCDGEFRVTKLTCRSCGSTLEGEFEVCAFCRMTPEQREFVEVFLVSRGNIREVERVLGMSYPTVRARLDDVIRTLGYNVQRPAETVDRRAVLEALDRGEITAEEALKRLRGE